MKCPKCEFKNPDDAQFCIECGNPIEFNCPQFNAITPSTGKFCKACGYDYRQVKTPKEPSEISTISDPTTFANDHYQIKEKLGEGAKKKVYRAYDTLLDRDIALALIKTEGLDEDAKARITREAQAMGRVGTHENIVMIFDLGDIDGQPFIVSEILGGGDVEVLIQKTPNHKLPQEQVIDMAQAICNGLQYAHDKGIVHRDLKPSNVYLTDSGRVKIGDFGLAIVDDRTRLTMEGMMVGTMSYMAPEQATGGEITPKSDLYALGAMLYEMVTGRPPFVGDDILAIIGQHINTPPISPSWHNPDITRSLEALILKLLEKNANDRPVSATDVNKSLELIKRGATEKVLPHFL
jgi:serine/threonine-protein kinase